jgi:hypothetical protein
MLRSGTANNSKPADKRPTAGKIQPDNSRDSVRFVAVHSCHQLVHLHKAPLRVLVGEVIAKRDQQVVVTVPGRPVPRHLGKRLRLLLDIGGQSRQVRVVLHQQPAHRRDFKRCAHKELAPPFPTVRTIDHRRTRQGNCLRIGERTSIDWLDKHDNILRYKQRQTTPHNGSP